MKNGFIAGSAAFIILFSWVAFLMVDDPPMNFMEVPARVVAVNKAGSAPIVKRGLFTGHANAVTQKEEIIVQIINGSKVSIFESPFEASLDNVSIGQCVWVTARIGRLTHQFYRAIALSAFRGQSPVCPNR